MAHQTGVVELTFEEFVEQYGGRRYEYVDGRALPMGPEIAGPDGEMTVGPTKLAHGMIVEEMSFLLGSFVRKHRLGRVLGAETGFLMTHDPEQMRAADVAFVSDEVLAQVTDPGDWLPFPPDLAVEVVSEHDRAADLRRKIDDYLRYGTRLLWVIYPDQRRIDVYAPGAPVVALDEDGTLDGGEVLPGFQTAVRDLFAVLDRFNAGDTGERNRQP